MATADTPAVLCLFMSFDAYYFTLTSIQSIIHQISTLIYSKLQWTCVKIHQDQKEQSDFCMLQCNLNGFKAPLPQAHGSFKAVLLVSLQVAVSPSRSTGLQLGTDAGMSSVLLTMIRFPQDLFGFGVSNRCPLLRAVVRVCCMAFSVRRNGCLVICKDITKTQTCEGQFSA